MSNTDLVTLFMFSYQHTLRRNLEICAKGVLEAIGLSIELDVLLVGARAHDSAQLHPVCIEPEDDKWSLEPFAELLQNIEKTISVHPDRNLIYGDEASMRDKPENIRRDSVSRSVESALQAWDVQNAVRSFCGEAIRVNDYYVVPVIQIPAEVLMQHPPIAEHQMANGWSLATSFVQCCLTAVLGDASRELMMPEPGRFRRWNRSAKDTARGAADNFMYTPSYLVADQPHTAWQLLKHLDLMSSLMYEGDHGRGRMILTKSSSAAIEYNIRFQTAVPFREPRWARKILQMASDDLSLIANDTSILGIGRLRQGTDPVAENIFFVDFLEHFYWQIRSGNQILFRSRYGEPTLPQEFISQARFLDNATRLFPTASQGAQERMWALFQACLDLSNGALIIVASDAEEEAKRLAMQGTMIAPTELTPDLLRRVSRIDGTIIVDQECVCHAVGVILDGIARSDCKPARGARFNSAWRYTHGVVATRLAIVVSEDRTVDLFPILQPRIMRKEIEERINKLKKTGARDHHEPRNWLDDHRFYINEDQCAMINEELARIKEVTVGDGRLFVNVGKFSPDPEMNDSYFIEDEET